ncbi:uncharacterized protein LOC144861199 [Branchiostoma floridae x Branchiostoma japonicum]
MMVPRFTILILAVSIVTSNTTATNITEGSGTARTTTISVFGSDNSTDAVTATTEASNTTSHRHRNGTFIAPEPKLIDEDSGIGIDAIFGEPSNETEAEDEDLGSGISNAANGSRTGDSNPKTQGEHPNKIVPSSRTTARPNDVTTSTEGIIISVILAGHGLNQPSVPPKRDRGDSGDFLGTTDAPVPKPVPKSSSGNLVVIIPLVCLGFVLLVLVVVLHCQNTRERRRVRQLKVLMRRDARMSGRSTDPLWRSDRSCTSRGARSSTSRGARTSSRSQRSQRSYELKELPHCAECYHSAARQKQTNGYPGGKSGNGPVTRSDPNILGHRSTKGPVEYFLDDELYKISLTTIHRKTQSEPTRLNAQMALDDAVVETPFQRVPNNSPAGSCPTTPHPRYINMTEPDNHLLAASLSRLDKWTDNRLYEPPDDVALNGGVLPLHHLQLFPNRDVYQDLNSNSIQSSMGPGLDSDFGASAGLSLRIMSSDSSITGYPTTNSGHTGEALSTESSLTSTITPTPASSTAWAGQGETDLYHTLSGRDNQGQVPLLSMEEHWV